MFYGIIQMSKTWARNHKEWGNLFMLTSLQSTATSLKLSEHRRCFLKSYIATFTGWERFSCPTKHSRSCCASNLNWNKEQNAIAKVQLTCKNLSLWNCLWDSVCTDHELKLTSILLQLIKTQNHVVLLIKPTSSSDSTWEKNMFQRSN